MSDAAMLRAFVDAATALAPLEQGERVRVLKALSVLVEADLDTSDLIELTVDTVCHALQIKDKSS